MMKNQRGFTIMQLMGVLLIIAIVIILVSVISMEFKIDDNRRVFGEWFEIELPERKGNLYTGEELAAIRPSVCKTLGGHRKSYSLANDSYHMLIGANTPAEPWMAQEHLDNVIEARSYLEDRTATYERAQQVAQYIPGLVPEEGCQQ